VVADEHYVNYVSEIPCSERSLQVFREVVDLA
jgi:hypothetical protein